MFVRAGTELDFESFLLQNSALTSDDEDYIEGSGYDDGDDVQEDPGYQVQVTVDRLDPCTSHKFEVKSKYADDEFSKKEVAAEAVTLSPAEAPMEIAGAVINVTGADGDDLGHAELSWVHQLSCVKRYKVVVNREGESETAEKSVPAPEDAGFAVPEIPLHEMLSLQNCQKYEILILPDDGDDDDDELMLATAWNSGFKASFRYRTEDGTLPDPVAPEDVIEIEITRANSVVFAWPEPFTCSDFKVEVSDVRDDGKIVTAGKVSHSAKEYSATGLAACTKYAAEFVAEDDNNTTLAKKTFTTEAAADGEAVAPLDADEVTITGQDMGRVTVEWAGRCLDSSIFSICSSDACADWNKTMAVVHSSGQAAVTLGDLSNCGRYNFSVGMQSDKTLYLGSFVTKGDFQFYPSDMRIEFGEDWLSSSWSDNHACVDSYTVSLFDSSNNDDEATLISSESVKRNSSSMKSEMQSLELAQCTNYTVVVSPASEAEAANGNNKSMQILYFTRPEAPKDLIYAIANASTVVISWPRVPCHTGHRMLISDLKGIKSITLTNGESSHTISGLARCTQHTVEVWSLAGNQTSSDPSTLSFVTEHSQEEEDEEADVVEIGTDEITVGAIPSHGRDCVSRYKVVLCDFGPEVRSCQSKTVSPEESAVFKNLTEATVYVYQRNGYDEDDREIFISQQRQITTKTKASAEILIEKVTDTSIHLLVSLSDVPDLEEEPTARVECEGGGVIVRQDSTKGGAVAFEKLPPFADFLCSGVVHLGLTSLPVDEAIRVRTLDGIPGAPRSAVGRASESGSEILIRWEPPAEANGELREYVVTAREICRSAAAAAGDRSGFCEEECADSLDATVKGKLYAVIPARPASRYELTVKARTRHAGYGPESAAISVATPLLKPPAPVITKVREKSESNAALLEFNLPCPHTGPTRFTAAWNCSSSDDCNRNISVERIDRNVLRLSGFSYGHFYSVRVIASVPGCREDKCESESEAKVVYFDCGYTCADGSCVAGGRYTMECDGNVDCADGSDENHCSCDPPAKFACVKNSFCIDGWKRCDGNTDCGDGISLRYYDLSAVL